MLRIAGILLQGNNKRRRRLSEEEEEEEEENEENEDGFNETWRQTWRQHHHSGAGPILASDGNDREIEKF